MNPQSFTSFLLSGAVALAGAPALMAQNEGLSKPEQAFITKAAADGIAEVQLGQVAEKKATSKEVKEFGAHMVKDHTKANNELKAVASKKGVNVPPDTDAKHKAEAEKLSALNGEEFDKAYLAQMGKDHQTAVSQFEKMSKEGKDPDLKGLVEKTLPALRTH